MKQVLKITFARVLLLVTVASGFDKATPGAYAYTRGARSANPQPATTSVSPQSDAADAADAESNPKYLKPEAGNRLWLSRFAIQDAGQGAILEVAAA